MELRREQDLESCNTLLTSTMRNGRPSAKLKRICFIKDDEMRACNITTAVIFLIVLAGNASAEYRAVPARMDSSLDWGNKRINLRVFNDGRLELSEVKFDLIIWDCQSQVFDKSRCVIVLEEPHAWVSTNVPPGQARDISAGVTGHTSHPYNDLYRSLQNKNLRIRGYMFYQVRNFRARAWK